MNKKKLIIGGFVLFILIGVLAAAGYYFLSPPAFEVSLEFVDMPEQILVGQPFDVAVSFSNHSDKIVQDAKLSLVLPEGVAFVGLPQDQRGIEESLGDLGPGNLNQKKFSVIVLNEKQNVKHIEARISYNTEGFSRARFENQASADIVAGQPAFALLFDASEKVFSGERFDVRIAYENNSGEELKNVKLRLEYPKTFQLEKAEPVATTEGNVWDLGSVPKGAIGEIVVTGIVAGQENSFFEFKGLVTSELSGQVYEINSQAANLVISPAPLDLRITANDTVDHVAAIGETLNYVLSYRNNSNTALENVIIRANLSGELFDFKSVRTDGAFNSVSNTFTWNAGNVSGLANLLPGEAGSVRIYVQLKNDFPMRRLSDKDYVVKMGAEIESKTVPAETGAAKTLSFASIETKVAGKAIFEATGYYKESAKTGIQNTGPYPPKVNQPTQYTIHWKIKNYSTDLADVRVSAFLQSGSSFTGKTTSSINEKPTYNPASGEVSWVIKKIPAGAGILTSPLEAVFQIENIPSVNKTGQDVLLIGDAKFEAVDLFTNTRINVSSPQISTNLPSDTNASQTSRQVLP